MGYEHRFQFPLGGNEGLSGTVRFEDAGLGECVHRRAVLKSDGGRALPIFLTHCEATESFIYLGKPGPQLALRELLREWGIDLDGVAEFSVPGQFALGPERSALVARGVASCLGGSAWDDVWDTVEQGELVTIPVLREGMKYSLSEAVLSSGGLYCDEIVADAHHVVDETVPGLGRRVTLKAFKDADLSATQRERVKVVVIGDSVASGTVIIGLIEEVRARFPNLERIELVAPLAALYGLARIAKFAPGEVELRIHCFETLLDSLTPDFYYSPHFANLEMHISREAEECYREWWGKDREGSWVSDTACAGFGWSEAFFNPPQQLRMIDAELRRRNAMGLADIFAQVKSV